MKQTYSINGMHCDSCVKWLTDAFQSVAGVRSAHVSLNPPQAHIESDALVTTEALDHAARAAGNYSVNGSTQTKAPVPHERGGPEAVAATAAAPAPSIYPLVLIVLYLAGTVALATYVRSTAGWSWHTFMNDFMAGFFLVFSFFKLLDLRGFADAYQSYDIIARRSRLYAFAYPFIELALGWPIWCIGSRQSRIGRRFW